MRNHWKRVAWGQKDGLKWMYLLLSLTTRDRFLKPTWGKNDQRLQVTMSYVHIYAHIHRNSYNKKKSCMLCAGFTWLCSGLHWAYIFLSFLCVAICSFLRTHLVTEINVLFLAHELLYSCVFLRGLDNCLVDQFIKDKMVWNCSVAFLTTPNKG